jgi:beta-phosphoglucomutase-like phosphatase (HAD superfamily)
MALCENLKLNFSCCRLAAGELKGLDGLQDLCKWIEDRNLKRAAVTNATRANAELMLSLLGLTSFFPVLVIGSECERAKPSPDPYLKALELIGASPGHTFIFEVMNLTCMGT